MLVGPLQKFTVLVIHTHLYRNGISLESHLWIISELLMKKQDPPDTLLPYIVSVCHPKIYRRAHTGLSIQYRESLFRVLEKSSENPIAFTPPPKDCLTEEAISNDDILLICLHDILFKDMNLGSKLQKLQEQALVAVESEEATSIIPYKRGEYSFYTETTWWEFHELLCGLLRGLETNLQTIERFRKKPRTLNSSEKCPPEFKKAVVLVYNYGYALQRIIHGSAIRQHLRNIQPLLDDPRRSEIWPRSEKKPQEVEDTDVLVAPRDPSTDLLPPLWRSYLEWLKIILAHFDAVEDLTEYVTSTNFRYTGFSIKILFAPHIPETTPLSLLALFNDRHLLPKNNFTFGRGLEPLELDSDDYVLPSRKDVVDFLSSIQSPVPRKALEDIGALRAVISEIGDLKGNDLKGQELEKAIKRGKALVVKMKKCPLPKWESTSGIIGKQLTELELPPPCGFERDIGVLTSEIVQTLDLLEARALLFKKINPDEPDLHHLDDTPMHCEAYLASLLYLKVVGDVPDEYKAIVHELKVNCLLPLTAGSSFMSIELWTNHWSLETVLPDVLYPNQSIKPSDRQSQQQAHYSRLSRYSFSMLPTCMHSAPHSQCHECIP